MFASKRYGSYLRLSIRAFPKQCFRFSRTKEILFDAWPGAHSAAVGGKFRKTNPKIMSKRSRKIFDRNRNLKMKRTWPSAGSDCSRDVMILKCSPAARTDDGSF